MINIIHSFLLIYDGIYHKKLSYTIMETGLATLKSIEQADGRKKTMYRLEPHRPKLKFTVHRQAGRKIQCKRRTKS